jgi:DNA polymerase III gamma/tau subunit
MQLARIARAEGVVTEPGDCEEIAKSGEGSMRDAVSNLAQVIGFAGNRPITTDDVCQCLGVTSVSKIHALGDALAKSDLSGAIAIEFPEEEGGVKGALSGVLSLLYQALIPNDPEEHRDMTVEAMRLRERQWIIHASDVIERNFWKLDNASFPNEHVLGEICTMIVLPETDPHCSNALAGISVQQPADAPVPVPADDDKKVDRILKGVMTVYREIHGMTNEVSGLSERVAAMDATKAPQVEGNGSTSGDMDEIRRSLEELRQTVSTISERSEAQGEAMKIIIDLLRSGGGGGGKRKPARRRKVADSSKEDSDGKPGDDGADEATGLSYRQPEF